MTDYGNWLLVTILLPIVAFGLGILWNEASHQLKRERDAE